MMETDVELDGPGPPRGGAGPSMASLESASTRRVTTNAAINSMFIDSLKFHETLEALALLEMIDQSALEDFKPVMAMLEKYEAGGARRHGFDRSMATSPSTLARLPRSPGGRTSDVNMAEPSEDEVSRAQSRAGTHAAEDEAEDGVAEAPDAGSLSRSPSQRQAPQPGGSHVSRMPSIAAQGVSEAPNLRAQDASPKRGVFLSPSMRRVEGLPPGVTVDMSRFEVVEEAFDFGVPSPALRPRAPLRIADDVMGDESTTFMKKRMLEKRQVEKEAKRMLREKLRHIEDNTAKEQVFRMLAMERAAARVQAAWKGYLTRKWFRQLLARTREMDRLQAIETAKREAYMKAMMDAERRDRMSKEMHWRQRQKDMYLFFPRARLVKNVAGAAGALRRDMNDKHYVVIDGVKILRSGLRPDDPDFEPAPEMTPAHAPTAHAPTAHAPSAQAPRSRAVHVMSTRPSVDREGSDQQQWEAGTVAIVSIGFADDAVGRAAGQGAARSTHGRRRDGGLRDASPDRPRELGTDPHTRGMSGAHAAQGIPSAVSAPARGADCDGRVLLHAASAAAPMPGAAVGRDLGIAHASSTGGGVIISGPYRQQRGGKDASPDTRGTGGPEVAGEGAGGAWAEGADSGGGGLRGSGTARERVKSRRRGDGSGSDDAAHLDESVLQGHSIGPPMAHGRNAGAASTARSRRRGESTKASMETVVEGEDEPLGGWLTQSIGDVGEDGAGAGPGPQGREAGLGQGLAGTARASALAGKESGARAGGVQGARARASHAVGLGPGLVLSPAMEPGRAPGQPGRVDDHAQGSPKARARTGLVRTLTFGSKAAAHAERAGSGADGAVATPVQVSTSMQPPDALPAISPGRAQALSHAVSGGQPVRASPPGQATAPGPLRGSKSLAAPSARPTEASDGWVTVTGGGSGKGVVAGPVSRNGPGRMASLPPVITDHGFNSALVAEVMQGGSSREASLPGEPAERVAFLPKPGRAREPGREGLAERGDCAERMSGERAAGVAVRGRAPLLAPGLSPGAAEGTTEDGSHATSPRRRALHITTLTRLEQGSQASAGAALHLSAQSKEPEAAGESSSLVSSPTPTGERAVSSGGGRGWPCLRNHGKPGRCGICPLRRSHLCHRSSARLSVPAPWAASQGLAGAGSETRAGHVRTGSAAQRPCVSREGRQAKAPAHRQPRLRHGPPGLAFLRAADAGPGGCAGRRQGPHRRGRRVRRPKPPRASRVAVGVPTGQRKSHDLYQHQRSAGRGQLPRRGA